MAVAIIVIVIVVVLLAALAGAVLLRRRALRRRFGPEYDRLAREVGERRAVSELSERQRRIAAIDGEVVRGKAVQPGVRLEGHDLALVAHQVGHDDGVVAIAGPDIDDCLATAKVAADEFGERCHRGPDAHIDDQPVVVE